MSIGPEHRQAVRNETVVSIAINSVVPAAIIDRMRRANERSREHAVAEGIAIAREMFERIRPLVQGVQVSAPFGKVELALQVLGDLDAAPGAPAKAEVT